MDQERIEKCLQSQGYWAQSTDKTIEHPYKKGYKMRNNTQNKLVLKTVVLLVIICITIHICL